jgi:hypothetical protein
MKNSALQIAKQIVNDNREFISGNIADHMINELENNEFSLYSFITDEEIEDIESTDFMHDGRLLHKKLIEDCQNMWRNNFDYDVENFDYNNF